MQPPSGTWDCHIHLFGPSERFPQHPDSPYPDIDATAEVRLALQDRLGIEKSVIIGCAGAHSTDYRIIADALERFPDRFRGVIVASNELADRKDEIARLDRLGVRGVRMFAHSRPAHIPGVEPTLAASVAELGWHVQFVPYRRAQLAQDKDMLLALPNANIVLDHFGVIDAGLGPDQPAFKAMLEMLDTGRVWVKLSCPMFCADEPYPYPSMTKYARTLVEHAPERMLWGSDWPQIGFLSKSPPPGVVSASISPPSEEELLELFAIWVPDPEMQKRILVDNPRALYGE